MGVPGPTAAPLARRGACARLFPSCGRCTSLIYYSSYITLFCCLNFHSHDFMLKNILKSRLCISQPLPSWVTAGCLPRAGPGAREEGLGPGQQAACPAAQWSLPAPGEAPACHPPVGPEARGDPAAHTRHLYALAGHWAHGCAGLGVLCVQSTLHFVIRAPRVLCAQSTWGCVCRASGVVCTGHSGCATKHPGLCV